MPVPLMSESAPALPNMVQSEAEAMVDIDAALKSGNPGALAALGLGNVFGQGP